jgi:hypothetical protein
MAAVSVSRQWSRGDPKLGTEHAARNTWNVSRAVDKGKRERA